MREASGEWRGRHELREASGEKEREASDEWRVARKTSKFTVGIDAIILGGKDMGFEDLDVWKRARRLSVSLYRCTKDLRDFGFRDQLTRSGLSIPSNIAEGYERDSDAEIARFLSIAKGSAGELRTQVLIGIDAGYLDRRIAEDWADEARQLGRMLGALIRRHRKTSQ